MQCPFCRSEGVPDEAVYCPHCRYQFRPAITEPEPGPVQHTAEKPESIEDPQPGDGPDGEIRLLEALLLTPAILVMIVTAVVISAGIGTLPALTLTIAGHPVTIAGAISLVFGALAGWIFYRVMLARLG